MKVHFCRSLTPGGLFIQAATFSRWNHVGIEIGGVVFDATFFHGVATWSVEGFIGRYREVETVEIQLPDEQAALAFLLDQVGKSYDWKALLSLPFRGSWHDSDKWFCSELLAACLVRGGLGLLDVVFKGHRVTPRDTYLAILIISGKTIKSPATVGFHNQ